MIKSFTRYLFIHINSPDNTFLIYKLDVIGSKLSVLPNIYDVEAVGINAVNNEFLIPYYMTSFFN